MEGEERALSLMMMKIFYEFVQYGSAIFLVMGPINNGRVDFLLAQPHSAFSVVIFFDQQAAATQR